MRTLLGEDDYAWPESSGRPWVRANMVSTVDGAAQGPDGRSGTINTAADRTIFQQLRRTADVVVVGGGTARAERYRPAETPLVVISRSGALPETLQDAPAGWVRLEHGGGPDDLRALMDRLAAEGRHRVLVEGGPSLLADLAAAGLLDELCWTISPRLIAGQPGDYARILRGAPVDLDLELVSVLEEDGTLLTRWRTRRDR